MQIIQLLYTEILGLQSTLNSRVLQDQSQFLFHSGEDLRKEEMKRSNWNDEHTAHIIVHKLILTYNCTAAKEAKENQNNYVTSTKSYVLITVTLLK